MVVGYMMFGMKVEPEVQLNLVSGDTYGLLASPLFLLPSINLSSHIFILQPQRRNSYSDIYIVVADRHHSRHKVCVVGQSSQPHTGKCVL